MLVDFNDLYVRAYNTKVPGIPGTWIGHKDTYESYRIGLGRMIKTRKVTAAQFHQTRMYGQTCQHLILSIRKHL